MAPQSGEDKIRVLRVIRRLNVGWPSIHVVNLSAGLEPNRIDQILVVGKESRDEDVGLRAHARCVAASTQRDCHFFQSFTARPRR